MNFEIVIGLEIHAQLSTQSKIFSSAPNRFGDEPNTNISEVCTGQPGALPILNKEAVRKAIQFGLSVDGKIADCILFDRKSYFYPDTPRNFQITQFYHPIIQGGKIAVEVNGDKKEFLIEHAHLEDDAGSFKHFTSFGGVDYNRAGAPLIEIVSKPCMHSPEEAAAYAMGIKAILEYIGASDCNMDKGSMRIDANVSVRLKGEKGLRPKTEIKNINSFAFMQIALKLEIERQINLYTKHPDKKFDQLIKQETYRFDASKKKNYLMRKKESAADYRYCPEPDIPPVFISKTWIDEIKTNLPELPFARKNRYISEYGLTPYSAIILTNEKMIADYFEEGLEFCENKKALCNWITVEFAGRLKDSGKTLFSLGIPAEHIAKLINLIDKQTITGRMAKKIADIMIEHPQKDPDLIIQENPEFKPIEDLSTIDPIVDQVISENPDSIAAYRSGRKKAFAFLVGSVMKLTKGKADPALVTKLLHKKLDSNT